MNRISFYFKFSLVLFLSINTIFSQDSNHSLKVLSNPQGTDYWWLEKNNRGKSVVNTEIEYKWTFKKKDTLIKISLSNAYKDYRSIHTFNKPPINSDAYPDIIDYNIKNWLWLGETFIEQKFGKEKSIKLGKYYRDFSTYLNDNLSSGSMITSFNAPPVPKIGFLGMKTFNKKISLNYSISHGVLANEGYYTKKPFLHEKFIYLNIKKNSEKKFSFGLVHAAIWGGATPESGDHPSSFKDFLKVVISDDGPYSPPHANSLGSHLGIWDFFYEKTNNEKVAKFYYQHFFEDTSSLRFANGLDGLWGVELNNYLPNTNLLLEYVDTTNSSSTTDYGNDFYYWNFQYRLGWAYKDKIIGNPFINTNFFTEEQFIKVVHFGIESNFLSSNFGLKLSRDTNINDALKYKINMDKSIANNITINTFIVGEESKIGFGLGFTFTLE
tara:strand:- start:636 stop:1952 length:1317 start_codon:yes stop_codon:yes gene_type:complete